MLPATSLLSYFEAFGQLLVNRNLQRAFIHRPGQPTSLRPACQMKKKKHLFLQAEDHNSPNPSQSKAPCS